LSAGVIVGIVALPLAIAFANVGSSGTNLSRESRDSVDVRPAKELYARQARDITATGGNAESNGQAKRERRANSHDREEPGHQRADEKRTGARHQRREWVVDGVHITQALTHEGASTRITENCDGHGNGEAEKQRKHSEILQDKRGAERAW
jgi:hypothetical protein